MIFSLPHSLLKLALSGFIYFFQSDLKFISLIDLKEAAIDFTDFFCLYIFSFIDETNIHMRFRKVTDGIEINNEKINT